MSVLEKLYVTHICDILDQGKLVIPEPVQLPHNLIVGGEARERSSGLHVHCRKITLWHLKKQESKRTSINAHQQFIF